MEFVISDFVAIRQKYSIVELSAISTPEQYIYDSLEIIEARVFGYNPTKIRIKDDWYDVLPLSVVARSKSPVDGGFHFIYIQINLSSNEYYVGKVNRKKWSEIKRYQGSGLKFKNKYKGHETEFVRYFILCTSTAKESEIAEAKIVDNVLLSDPKCLNLVSGGAGTNEHYDREKRVTHQRQYMKSHPEAFQSMVEVAKKLYCSGDTDQLKKRNESIKATMSDEHYKELSRERIQKWKLEHPDAYQRSRENNLKAIQSREYREKRSLARKKWIEEHPEEYEAQEAILKKARNTPEARKKRSESLKEWAKNNPEKAKENARKRAEAAGHKNSKPVNMCDLRTGAVIRSFNSQHEAAQWLVDNGLAKNLNCVSSINAVCQRKPCSTGYGIRKKAYGFDWQYADQIEDCEE